MSSLCKSTWKTRGDRPTVIKELTSDVRGGKSCAGEAEELAVQLRASHSRVRFRFVAFAALTADLSRQAVGMLDDDNMGD